MTSHLLEWLVDSIVLSIFIGSIYVLASLGLTLTLAVVKLPNFAHAEFLTIGAYTGALISSSFPENFLLMGVGAFVVSGLIAVVIHFLVYKPMMDRKISIYTMVLASFAVATFVRYGVFSWASISNLLSTHPSVSIVVVGSIGTTPITNIYEIVVPLALVLSAVVGLFLTVTRLGKSMRAVASNFELARVTGIRLSIVVPFMWVIAGGLAGLGGVFLGIYTAVTPVLGSSLLLQIFAVVIIAGLTSMSGTVIGGYIVGFAENTLMAALNNFFGVPFTFEPLLPFAMILVVLMFRPTGLTPNMMSGIAYARRWLNRSKTKVPKEGE
ncbi:MAG: branched-chain amino acid ABC transporter permease [Thaumarchaeota archaeon]|nr:MAG: branched-chain amino acid ABC transporter permease [Nitrososphaerota archaeon]